MSFQVMISTSSLFLAANRKAPKDASFGAWHDSTAVLAPCNPKEGHLLI
jgi:hypothetical protein